MNQIWYKYKLAEILLYDACTIAWTSVFIYLRRSNKRHFKQKLLVKVSLWLNGECLKAMHNSVSLTH
jgi:hypothetical protein